LWIVAASGSVVSAVGFATRRENLVLGQAGKNEKPPLILVSDGIV
jgi:hypothetical protein